MGLSSSYVKICPPHFTVALLKRSQHNVLFICKIFLPAWTSLFILNMKPTSRGDNDCFVLKGKFQNVECTTAQISLSFQSNFFPLHQQSPFAQKRRAQFLNIDYITRYPSNDSEENKNYYSPEESFV